jgi:hypothetical protein
MWHDWSCSLDRAAAKCPEIRCASPSLDGIADGRTRGNQAWSCQLCDLCLYGRGHRHRYQHGSHHDSTVDLVRAGFPRHGRLRRSYRQYSAACDTYHACVDSRLPRNKAQILSHAPRYHALMRCMSGPAVINWSTNPTTCTISIKAHAVISPYLSG